MTGPAPICLDCKFFHQHDVKLTCDAFPDGIPEAIINTAFVHTQPYPGDHGIQYAARPRAKAIGVLKSYSAEDGHTAGIPGHQGGSLPAGVVLLDKYSQVKTRPGFGKGYWIMPDDKLIDVSDDFIEFATGGSQANGHIGFMTAGENYKLFGLNAKQGELLRNIFGPNGENYAGSDAAVQVFAALHKTGAIRVCEFQQQTAIDTYNMDNKTLHRLQRLMDEDKFSMKPGTTLTWTSMIRSSDGSNNQSYSTSTYEDFISAKYIVPKSGRERFGEMQLKEQPTSSKQVIRVMKMPSNPVAVPKGSKRYVGILKTSLEVPVSQTDIIINTEENDDWMKSLPGYKDETRITIGAIDDPVKKSFPDHKGRPGIQGGSLPKDSLPTDVTAKEYSALMLFNDLNLNNPHNIPIYVRTAQLPSVKEGFTRVYHGTHISNIQGILDNGLQPGSATGNGESLPFIMGTTLDPSSFGAINIVVDAPSDIVRKVNESWVEITGSIKPKDIVGIMPIGMSTRDVTRLIQIYQDYEDKYGKKL
jgi:hypothetical protein